MLVEDVQAHNVAKIEVSIPEEVVLVMEVSQGLIMISLLVVAVNFFDKSMSKEIFSPLTWILFVLTLLVT